MKYLENLKLEELTNSISSKVLAGGRVIDGRIETYSAKRAGEEKKKSKKLEQRIGSLPTVDGELTPKSEVKLSVDMIQTLNASLVDYDFSSLTPDSFAEIPVADAVDHVNNRLAELTIEEPMFLTNLWKSIDEAMLIDKCEVFCLCEDPFADGENGVLWSFVFFFVSRDLKRICLFACIASSRFRNNSIFGSVEDEEEYTFDEDEMNVKNRNDDESEDEIESLSQDH